jgi:hypothetical protein
MNQITKRFVGTLFLLGSALSAHAVQVTSVSAQTGRVEGQSVDVSAAVNWELPGPTLTNPLTGPFFSVSAQAGGKTIVLLFDSATGRYKGQFQDLPFNRYPTTVTAKKTTRTATLPITTTNVIATRQTSFLVGPQAGCFNFDQVNSVQGWSAVGMFNGDQSTNLNNANLAPTWSSSFGFLSPNSADADGGIVSNVTGNMIPPAASLPSGFSRFDFRSPDVSADTRWQSIRGLSFRMATDIVGMLQVQPLLSVRRPDGANSFLRQVDSGGNPVFITLFGGELVYRVFTANIPVPAGYTVLGTRLRVFNPVGSLHPSFVLLDGVCPRL